MTDRWREACLSIKSRLPGVSRLIDRVEEPDWARSASVAELERYIYRELLVHMDALIAFAEGKSEPKN